MACTNVVGSDEAFSKQTIRLLQICCGTELMSAMQDCPGASVTGGGYAVTLLIHGSGCSVSSKCLRF